AAAGFGIVDPARCLGDVGRSCEHEPAAVHRMRLMIEENHEITLVLVQLLDRLQQLVPRSLELAVLIHAARAIDDVDKRLPVAANSEKLSRGLARRTLTLSAATAPGSAAPAVSVRFAKVARGS